MAMLTEVCLSCSFNKSWADAQSDPTVYQSNVVNSEHKQGKSYLGFLLAGVCRRGFGCLILVPFVLFAPTFVLNHVGRRDHPPYLGFAV